MAPKVKCRKGHIFDLTNDMLIPFKGGKGVRTNCPECGVSVILSWKTVAELLNTSIDGAKDYITSVSVGNGNAPKKPLVKGDRTATSSPIPIIDLTEPLKDYSYDSVDASKSYMVTPEEIDEIEPATKVLQAIERYEKENKMTEEHSADVTSEDEPTPEEVVKKTPFEEALEKTPGEILSEVINSSDLPPNAKEELLDFLSYREHVQPNELQTILEQYGITQLIAKKIATRYSFRLNAWNEKKMRANRISDMMGPLGNISMPGYNPPFGAPVSNQPPLPGQTPGNFGTQVPPNQASIMWMIQNYQANPQGFMMWLQSNPQYMPLWNQALQQMQMNPMMMGMSPMMPQMMNPMMMGMNQRNGPSRDEVKKMINEETGKQLDGLKQYLNQMIAPKSNDASNIMLPLLLKLIENKTESHPAPQDPNAAMMPQLIQTLLSHTLETSRGDPAMGAVVEELKELKKGLEGGGSGTSRTIEEFQKMIEAMKLQSEIELNKNKFEQEKISAERNRELIKETINNVVPAIGNVVASMAQRGSSVPPQQVMGTYTENTNTLPCPSCGNSIVFPRGTTSVICPKCGKVYGVEVEPQDVQSEESSPIQVVSSPDFEVNVSDTGETENEISDADQRSFRKEGVF